MKQICLTFDVDWAPEAVIEDTLMLLEEYQVRATFFATHKSEVLQNISKGRHEIALHPNYNSMFYGDEKFDAIKPISTLLEIYSEAIGIRTHGLVMCPPIIDALRELGLQYDSSLLVWDNPQATSFELFSGLFRIPFHWEDDVQFYRDGMVEEWQDKEFSNTYIFNYHPVHVFINTDKPETYLNAKSHYQNAAELLKHRNTTYLGSRDHLLSVLKQISVGNLSAITMSQHLFKTAII